MCALMATPPSPRPRRSAVGVSAVIATADPQRLVGSGCWTMIYSTDFALSSRTLPLEKNFLTSSPLLLISPQMERLRNSQDFSNVSIWKESPQKAFAKSRSSSWRPRVGARTPATHDHPVASCCVRPGLTKLPAKLVGWRLVIQSDSSLRSESWTFKQVGFFFLPPRPPQPNVIYVTISSRGGLRSQLKDGARLLANDTSVYVKAVPRRGWGRGVALPRR